MKSKVKFFTTIIFLCLVALGTSYFYGTHNPNKTIVDSMVRDAEKKIMLEFREAGFMAPDFTFNDNESFVIATKQCVDYLNLMTEPEYRVPSAIIIGMAAVESAYGRSRFAMEGNALFGVRTWSEDVPQMKPLGLPDAEFGVKKYTTKCESVKDMIRIINNHPAYEKFREERIIQQKDGKWDYAKLMDGLTAWSTNEQYKTLILKKIDMLNLP